MVNYKKYNIIDNQQTRLPLINKYTSKYTNTINNS